MGGLVINAIEYLRANLRDRYKDCYAVLKELLQNADDAGATELHVASLDRLDGASHPLLSGPSLIVVNNARFSFRNASAIHHAGLGSKGLDENKIGKFGLGLYSVFQLCEAFLYFSDPRGDDEQVDAKLRVYQRTGVLNPWKGERYPSWDFFSDEDQERLRHLTRSLLSNGTDDWFAICLPLRRQEHCREYDEENPQDWAIEPKFYGEWLQPPSDVFSPEHFDDVSRMLPLMSTLERVRFWRLTREAADHATLSAEIVRTAWQHVDWRTMPVGQAAQGGTIAVNIGDTSVRRRYVGVQERLEHPELQDLTGLDGWPRMDAQTDAGRNRGRAAVKQHAAVVLLEKPGDGALRTELAVFLPLADSSPSTHQASSSVDFELILHGYFFVDAGRMWVDFAKDLNHETTRQAWNRILFREGTLPLLITAFDEYARSLGAQPEANLKLCSLTRLFKESPTWQEEGQSDRICRDANWGFRLFSEGGRWCSSPASLPLVLLPGDDRTEPGLPFSVFPALREQANNLFLSFSQTPHLKQSKTSSWPDGLAEGMLRSVPVAEVAADGRQLGFLNAICAKLCERNHEAFFVELKTLLRRLLSETPLSRLRKCRAAVASLIQLLPASMTVPMPFKADLVRESERLYELLVAQATDVLPVPDVFLEDSVNRPKEVTTADAKTLLTAISKLLPSGEQEEAFHTLIGQTTAKILSHWRPDDASFLETFGDLPLFYVKNYADGRRHARSAYDLTATRERRMLFARKPKLCEKLQNCLVEEQILYLANGDLADLFGTAVGPVNGCDEEGCAALLTLRPILTKNIAPRRSLLTEMQPALAGGGKQEVRKALRYLLHGNRQAEAQGTDELVLFIDGENAWCAAARLALAASGQAWRLISPDLADLRPSEREHLRLRDCIATTVSPLFQNFKEQALDRQVFTNQPEWREQLIREWPEDAKDDLKRLPIFTCSDGGLTSITSQTFIRGNSPPPPAEVFPQLVLILDEFKLVESRKLADPMEVETLLPKVLERKDCHRHWQYIRDSLPGNSSPELKKKLQTTAWIPGPEGSGIAPCCIVSRDDLRDHIRLLRAAGAPLIHKLDLPAELVKSARWKSVEALGPRGEDLYRLLGQHLKDVPEYAIGSTSVRGEDGDKLMRLFAGADGRAAMPMAGLLQTLSDDKADVRQFISKHILTTVRTSLDANRTREVLRYLASRHEQSNVRDREAFLDAFNDYLEEGFKQPGFAANLHNLRFLNQENRWRASADLAGLGHNIAPANLLHRSHQERFAKAGFWRKPLLGRELSSLNDAFCGQAFDPGKPAIGCKLFSDYLQTWFAEDVPRDALAAVVAMLGNHDGFPELYEKVREVHSLTALREFFAWDVFESHKPMKMLEKVHFWILPTQPHVVQTVNLLHEDFKAAAAKNAMTLFDGLAENSDRRYFSMPGEERCYPIWLRQIVPDGLTRAEKLDILGKTVQAIREQIYGAVDGDFNAIWERITQVGQLDIEIAQDMILESSAILLEAQLSVKHSEKLRVIFARWHRVRQRATTAEREKNNNEKKASEQEKVEVLTELRSALVRDDATRQLLVAEIRKKLEADSYKATSIPFELFQNGDDAEVELEYLCGDGALLERVRPARIRNRFVVEQAVVDGRAVLRFAHWGRGINQFLVGGRDGRDQDFDRDLERMLVLQGSGKDESVEVSTRTGKFGMGFKSVFFVCDEPRVLSDSRSRFRVLAGVYPERLSPADEGRLERVLAGNGDALHKGTIVELSLRDPADAEQALSRFRKLVGYLVVFSRRIRKCRLLDQDFVWEPPHEIIVDKARPKIKIECGDIRTEPNKKLRSLVFRLDTDGYGAVLVPICSNGVALDANKGVPEIWVTTPTEPTAHGGTGVLIVNGRFDVNRGRTQLRQTPRNVELARGMGAELGEQLCRLHERSRQDWASLRQEIGCTEASLEEFWSSLWHACLPYLNRKTEVLLLREILFGSEHCGMYRLAREVAAIPTGLAGEYGGLTSLNKIRWRTTGTLTAADVWTAAAANGWVTKNIRPGAVVARTTAESLDGFCAVDARSLTLAVILRESMSNSQFVTPDAANELGRLVFPKRLREIAAHRDTLAEEQEIRAVLAQARFQTTTGSWSAADGLLIGHEPVNRKDEHLRAAFAPAEIILSSQYSGDGLEFFLACRKEMQASADLMARWLLNTRDDKKRKAGLEYLETGDHLVALRNSLNADRAALNASWLGDRGVREQVMRGMDDHRQAVILGSLKKAEELGPIVRPAAFNVTRPARAIFQDILEWWREHRSTILTCHDQIYPGRRPPRLSFSATQEQLNSDLSVRREWMIVIMLGSMHRIGRATRHQSRGFLERCDERKWLDVLAAPADDPAKWFGVMDEYLDQLEDVATYFQWMNQFLCYYQLSRWLAKYARAFEAVTRPNVSLADLNGIRDIANLRTSHIFSRSTGFDAPPCSRTMGLGAHFVLREVIRCRAAQSGGQFQASGRLARIAYVPSLAVRHLIDQITNKKDLSDPKLSKEQAATRIADVLSEYLGPEATFDQNYDIPLLALTWTRFADARKNILGSDDGQIGDDPRAFLEVDEVSEEDEA